MASSHFMTTEGYSLSESLSNSTCLQHSTPSSQLTIPELKSRTSINVSDCSEQKQLHVVMVPYPVKGQITPMLRFAELLTARQGADIRVTLVLNKHNYDALQQDRRTRPADTGATASTADDVASTAGDVGSGSQRKVEFTWVETGLPPDFNYNDLTGSNGLEYYLSVVRMTEPLQHLLQRLHQQSTTPVSCVLFGAFCPWRQYSVAAELGIPTRLFWTQSPAVLSIFYHLPLLVTNGFFPYTIKESLPGCINGNGGIDTTELVSYIPGLPPLHRSSFPTQLQVDNIDIDDPASYVPALKEQATIVRHCGGVIFNSCEELEKDACHALQQELPCPISLVGPLLPSAFLDGSNASNVSDPGGSLPMAKSECIKWLDGKQKHSILYIAFGSTFSPSADELQSIALGIKSSKQPYLWVIRRQNASFQDVSDILPNGFVEDTKDYGLIITWAPQLQVLSHPSVGAFLTHCGWNSTLESVSMGMPMISLPFMLDQPTNSAYVCEFWKVGVALKRQADGKVRSENVEKAVRTVFHEEEGLKMREKVGMLRNAARQAAGARGSSYVHIEKFIQALRNHAATPNMCSSNT